MISHPDRLLGWGALIFASRALRQGFGDGTGELVGAGGAFGLAVDAAHALGGFTRVHTLGEGAYALCVAVAAAGKAHIVKAAFGVDVKFYVARAYACWCVIEVHINISECVSTIGSLPERRVAIYRGPAKRKNASNEKGIRKHQFLIPHS